MNCTTLIHTSTVSKEVPVQTNCSSVEAASRLECDLFFVDLYYYKLHLLAPEPSENITLKAKSFLWGHTLQSSYWEVPAVRITEEIFFKFLIFFLGSWKGSCWKGKHVLLRIAGWYRTIVSQRYPFMTAFTFKIGSTCFIDVYFFFLWKILWQTVKCFLFTAAATAWNKQQDWAVLMCSDSLNASTAQQQTLTSFCHDVTETCDSFGQIGQVIAEMLATEIE